MKVATLFLVLTPLISFAETRLTDLAPAAVEWGTYAHPLFATNGVRVVEWGSAGNMGAMWPGSEIKIVKQVDPQFRLPEGKNYGSDLTNVVAVAGEWMTGVCLFARRMSFYHWLEYDIPAGAKEFTANLYVTDDPRGYQWWATANQQFTFRSFVDGREVATADYTRGDLSPGSGELLKKLKITLSDGAKRIRFQVENSSWGDGNSNTELLLHDGRFFP